MRGRLLRDGFGEEGVDGVLGSLGSEGLLSDARFCESYSASCVRRGQGPLRISAELRERGVAESLIDQTLAQLGVDWVQQAEQARRKRFGGELPKDFAAWAKQARFLQYRGFSHEQIDAACPRERDA